MIWVAILRPTEGDIQATEVWSLKELFSQGHHIDLRLRYNTDMRLLTLRMPEGTTREKMFAAFGHLTEDERRRLYNRRQHRMVR